MNWWMIAIGAALLLPFVVLVIGFYVRWVTYALDVTQQDMRGALNSGELFWGGAYWIVHFVAATAAGVWLLFEGLGV